MGICAVGNYGGIPEHAYTYPLNIITAVRIICQLALMLAMYYHTHARDAFTYSVFLASVLLAAFTMFLNSCSIVFIIQKFYWRKLESCLSLAAGVLSFLVIVILVFCVTGPVSIYVVYLRFIFITLFAGNGFAFYWASTQTSDSVSNSYMSGPTQNTANTLESGLSDDFDHDDTADLVLR
uniref:MARVEL domain-containing protein n=1 Tax=Panagrellus redivivus TaxID=6233 RepID=A0A7E4ZRL0_PANRE